MTTSPVEQARRAAQSEAAKAANHLARASWSRREFCDRYGISLGTFHNLVNSGALRAVKIGASTRVLRDDEELWLQSLTAIEPSAAA